MKLETLNVELRPRSSWEAMELGSALVRRHAAAIWVPWLLVTGTAFVLLNLAAWAVGQIWLALVAMWWLRPVFDRIPLYVLSRAVFGSVPGTAETLRAQLRWGWRPMRGHLTWRRFSPLRAAMLPIDLLEGADRALLGERRRVIGGGIGGHAVQLTVICVNFIWALQLSTVLLLAIAVPNELLPETARAAWALISEQPPAWALIGLNLVDWLAVSFIEPFYVGAGFGLYLNRRTQLEAWDLEIAFRRMRKRLEAGAAHIAGIALLAMALWLPMALPAQAADDAACPIPDAPKTAKHASGQDRAKTKQDQADQKQADQKPADAEPERANAKPDLAENPKDPGAAPDATTGPVVATPNDAAKTDANIKPGADEYADYEAAMADSATEDALETRELRELFGDAAVDHDAFGKAVDEAYRDPLLRPKQDLTSWQRKDRDKNKDNIVEPDMSQFKWLADIVGFIAEYGLWLLVAALVIALALTAKRWWPWLIGIASEPEPEPAPVDMALIAHNEPLPPDIATVARRLWAEGQPRRALALLYRAGVEAMTARIDAHPPPGATEADCLRLSRRMPEAEDRDIFQRMVRMWQYAAYGQRLPAADEFEQMLQTLAQRFRWAS